MPVMIKPVPPFAAQYNNPLHFLRIRHKDLPLLHTQRCHGNTVFDSKFTYCKGLKELLISGIIIDTPFLFNALKKSCIR